MHSRQSLRLASLAACAILCGSPVAVWQCGGQAAASRDAGTSSPLDGGASDECSSLPPGACIVPPAPPKPNPRGASLPTHTYAIHKLYIGDTDRSGVASPDAWKSFGYDLDGLVTTAASTDVCTLVPGSSKQVQIDGNGGIDNSYGANIVPIYLTLDSTFSQQMNQAIQIGAWTEMSVVSQFDDSAGNGSAGNTTSATGLGGVELIGGAFDGGTPSWNLSTHWPVIPEDLTCGPSCPPGTDPVRAAQMTFPGAYQAAGTFVSGTPFTFQLVQGISGVSFTLPIRGAVMTFQPKAPGSVTNGTIAGAILATDFIQALQSVPNSCAGAGYEPIPTEIAQASDIYIDPSTGAISNVPGVACNAVSIGIGFDATEIAPPSEVTGPTPPPPDPCGARDN